MSKVQYITIPNDIKSQRIDNFLISQFSNLPKTLIYRWIRKGELRVNKKRVKQTTKIIAGDIVRVPPFSIEETKVEKIKVSQNHLDFLESLIIYENDDYMIVNKPSGIAVHGGSGVNSGLVERLRQLRPKARRLDLAHRLDKETSGCVVLAKKHSSLVYFFDLFKNKKIEKTYYAIVHGKWDKKVKTIDVPLFRTETKTGDRIVKVDYKNGKQSITHIKNVKDIQNGKYSLLTINLETGRTHQIRVHCQFVKHPIVADKKYGFFDKDKFIFKSNDNKLLLHAGSIEFYDVKQQKNIKVMAPLDLRMKEFINLK